MTPQQIKKKTLDMLAFHLKEMDLGHRTFSTGELLQINSALSQETPSAYFILAAIHNALQFLDTQYEADDGTKETVERFLSKFQQHCVEDFLKTAASLPDGLFLMTETAQDD